VAAGAGEVVNMMEIIMPGEKKNALGTAMMRFLLGRIGEAGGQPILISGAGDAFSAGLDLREVASLDPAGMESFLRLLETLMSTLFAYPAPTVALVNGHAIAGGCILALACDYRIAPRATAARIGLNEVALGLRFPPKVLAIVRRRIPAPYVEQVILGSDLHDPDAALRLALLDEVVPEGQDARAVAVRKLERLASYPAVAYAAAKTELRGALEVSAEEERRFLEDVLPAWTSPELKARLLGALSRR
jgi:enoyl-CoA hydratase/carnithine racemase